jgi:serralysin
MVPGQQSNSDPTPQGTYTWHTIIHETGHTMGFAHAHSADSINGGFTATAMTPNRDGMEFSIMSYRNYIGSPTSGGYNNETYGFAQTLMMYDIAALQTLYGADFTQ